MQPPSQKLMRLVPIAGWEITRHRTILDCMIAETWHHKLRLHAGHAEHLGALKGLCLHSMDLAVHRPCSMAATATSVAEEQLTGSAFLPRPLLEVLPHRCSSLKFTEPQIPIIPGANSWVAVILPLSLQLLHRLC